MYHSLLKAMDEQEILLNDLLTLTREEKEVARKLSVETDFREQLLDLTAKRKILSNEIESLDNRIIILRDDLDLKPGTGMHTEYLTRLRKLIDMFSQIRDNDKSVSVLWNSHLKTLRSKMGKLRQNAQGYQTYMQPTSVNEAQFLDWKR
ncbi:MAG: hypothetical protein ACM3MK_00645 [Chitinophagales bacterium]